jgi:hypothetical protein
MYFINAIIGDKKSWTCFCPVLWKSWKIWRQSMQICITQH